MDGLIINGTASTQESSVNCFDMCGIFCYDGRVRTQEFVCPFDFPSTSQDIFVDLDSEFERKFGESTVSCVV